MRTRPILITLHYYAFIHALRPLRSSLSAFPARFESEAAKNIKYQESHVGAGVLTRPSRALRGKSGEGCSPARTRASGPRCELTTMKTPFLPQSGTPKNPLNYPHVLPSTQLPFSRLVFLPSLGDAPAGTVA